MDFKKFKPENRLFRLVGNKKPVAYRISERNRPRSPLMITDSEGKLRELRYATNMDTPFVDEQIEKGGTPITAHIWFRDGILKVDKNEIALQKFLSVHPDNQDNGGRLFYEVRKEDDAKKEIEQLETAVDAITVASQMDISDAEAIIYAQIGSTIRRYSSAEIKRDVLRLALNDAEKFTELANDEMIKVAYTAHQAIEYGILIEKGNSIYYKTGNKKLYSIPPGLDSVEGLTNFFSKTDDGIEAYKDVKAKLKKVLS